LKSYRKKFLLESFLGENKILLKSPILLEALGTHNSFDQTSNILSVDHFKKFSLL